jgi:hypothetical protein
MFKKVGDILNKANLIDKEVKSSKKKTKSTIEKELAS